MPKNKLQEMILAEVQGLRNEVKEVRQIDIPNIHVKIESFNHRIKTLDKQQTWATRIYTTIGGAIAIVISMMMSHKS